LCVPELPDVTIYLEALEPRTQERVLERIRVTGPSLQELEATHSP
jgi:formamidopyrimidine-DNA glycosylase